MQSVQQSLFPHLEACFPEVLTEPERQLVKILELIWIEQYVAVIARRQWLGWPIKEREERARAFVAKAVLQYPLPVRYGMPCGARRICA